MKLNRIAWLHLFKDTLSIWRGRHASRLSAALAYYTLFSIAPLLLIVIMVAGRLLGKQAAEGRLNNSLAQMIGSDGATAIQTLIQGVYHSHSGTLATVIGFAMLVWSASSTFSALQDALNTLWEATPGAGHRISRTIQENLTQFLLMVLTGALLLSSLVIDTTLLTIVKFFSDVSPGIGSVRVLQGLNFMVSGALLTLLLGSIYRFLPAIRLDWGDVWIGAIVTALLLMIGRLAIGFYVGYQALASAYSAIGSLIVLLIWVYYSAELLLFGAAFTRAYARRHGSLAGAAPAPAR